jgi:lipoprotein-anchoring transpeptidase ErfK/SrfK
MDTALGGMIEIHGDGTGEARNWTHGCVALHNRDLDRLWHRVNVGTPVVIE